jgi:hypothetical protein
MGPIVVLAALEQENVRCCGSQDDAFMHGAAHDNEAAFLHRHAKAFVRRRFLSVVRTIGIEEYTDRIGRELPRGKLLSTLSSPAILFADHAAPCRQALGGMLLHPLGELRRAYQAGLH